MLSPANQPLTFYAHYVASKAGKTGLVVTVDVYRDAVAVVTGAAATEVGGGLYAYTLAGASTATPGAYAAVFKTADATVDQQHVPALWLVGQGAAAGLTAAAGSPGGLALDEPGVIGPGSVPVTLTFYLDAAKTQPAANVEVWITTDADGDNVYAGTLLTSGTGAATFLLNPGETYYKWAQAPGINPVLGQAFVAVADPATP